VVFTFVKKDDTNSNQFSFEMQWRIDLPHI